MSSISEWLLFAPLWSIGLVAFGSMIIASLVGSALRRRYDRAFGERSDAEGGGAQGITVSAVMGLLALLFAFTFSMAIDRFDARRVNVLNEANAIGTTYLRAQLLELPHRDRMSKLLVDYTDTRIGLALAERGPERSRLLTKNDRLIGDLWTATVAAFPSMRPYNYSNAFIETMNNLIDMDAVRKAGRQAHVPTTVFVALLLYQFLAAGLVSYVFVARQERCTACVLFLLLGALLVLIIDVDRPTGGGITESQEPMLQLRDFLRTHPPATFDRFNTL